MRLFIIFLCCSLLGCYTSKKAGRALDKAMDKYSALAAEKFNKAFPRTITGTDTTYEHSFIEIECPDKQQPKVSITYPKTESGKTDSSKTKTIRIIDSSGKKALLEINSTLIKERTEDSAKIVIAQKKAADEVAAAKKETNKWIDKADQQENLKYMFLGIGFVPLLFLLLFFLLKRKP